MLAKNFSFLLELKRTKTMSTPKPSPVDPHQEIQLLLPWYLKQSLEPIEQQRVESHVRGCFECRREILFLRNLDRSLNQEASSEAATDRSFEILRKKLPVKSSLGQSQKVTPIHSSPAWSDKQPKSNSEQHGRQARSNKRASKASRYNFIRLGLAASLLLAALVPMRNLFDQSTTLPEYLTLSSAKIVSEGGRSLRVVFSRPLANTAIDSLVERIHGQQIEGPNSVGAYTIAMQSEPDLTAALAFLRSQDFVMFAEPVSKP
jgi:hypothetical protein